MKVTISVAGRWRAFRLAEHLQRHGSLWRVITGYPFWALAHERVDRAAIVSLPIVEIFGRALPRVPGLGRALPIAYWKMALFDRLAQRHVDGCDVFVGWAGFASRSLRAAKRHGAVTFIERESTHIQYSERLLQEEYDHCGKRGRPTDPRIVDMFLREYEDTDYVVVPSEFAYRSFTQLGFDERRLIKIPSGVDLNRFRPVPKEDETFRVIFVGGLNLRKGVQYLLEAASQLRPLKLEVVLVGSISEEIRPYLERYRDAFRYAGVVAQGELYKHYSQASVFVLPSIEEGMAYVVAEAMACGLPVIVSTNTGASEIVREGIDGYVVPIRDPEAIAERVQSLHADRERCHAMGRAARQRVSEFTWDRYAERAIDAYRAALASHGAST
jgi:glycosyltransferase involved in cell wall biosynthesis